jgi:hypothetical protein
MTTVTDVVKELGTPELSTRGGTSLLSELGVCSNMQGTGKKVLGV